MDRVSIGLRQANRLRRAELGRIGASAVFADPQGVLVKDRREKLDACFERIQAAQNEKLRILRVGLDRTCAKLEALSPLAVLERGYACVSSENGVLTSAAQAQIGMQVNIRFKDGAVAARIADASAEA